MLNGISHDVAPYAHTSNWNDTTFNLMLAQLDENYFLLSQLSISNVPRIVGHYPVIVGTGRTTEGPGAVFATYFHGDVAGDLFRYNSMLSYSYIQLDKYDNINQEIEGSFNLQLVRSTEYIASPELPDTLNIHGTFLTRIDYN